MRILFLEDDGLLKTVPYLRRLGHEPVVLRTGVYDRWHEDETRDLSIEVRHLEPHASSVELILAARSLRPDGVVSLALLEPESCRDGLVGDFFRRVEGLRVVANPPSAALLATDKLATKQLLGAEGIPVVEAVEVEDLAQARLASEWLGFPVVLKLRDAYAGRGMRFIEDADQLSRFYRRNPGPMLMEAFVEGLEISVEVLSWEGGTLALAPVYKGWTTADPFMHPLYRLRLAPMPLLRESAAEVESVAARSVALLGLVGTAECDLILSPDRGLRVLEVNPRLCATTPLSDAVTGIDSHLQLADMAIGRYALERPVPQERCGVQIPIRSPLDTALLARLRSSAPVRFIKPIGWVPSLGITATLTLCERDAPSLLRFLEEAAGWVDFAFAIQDLARLFDGAAKEVWHRGHRASRDQEAAQAAIPLPAHRSHHRDRRQAGGGDQERHRNRHLHSRPLPR